MNVLSLELGKSGVVWNLSYDHQIPSHFGVRAVGGSNFNQRFEVKNAGGGLYYLAGRKNRQFEAGIDMYYLYAYDPTDDVTDATYNYFDETTDGLYSGINLGYRCYGKKTMFRIGISPGIMEGDFVPRGYISYGIRF